MKRGAKTRPKDELHICLEKLDFSWYKKEVEKVKNMWEEGHHIKDIAQVMDREVDEVFLLLLDLIRRKKIKSRENGIYGRL